MVKSLTYVIVEGNAKSVSEFLLQGDDSKYLFTAPMDLCAGERRFIYILDAYHFRNSSVLVYNNNLGPDKIEISALDEEIIKADKSSLEKLAKIKLKKETE